MGNTGWDVFLRQVFVCMYVNLFANKKRRHVNSTVRGWTERPPGGHDNCPHKMENETQ